MLIAFVISATSAAFPVRCILFIFTIIIIIIIIVLLKVIKVHVICTPRPICSGDQSEKNEMGVACGTCGGEERRIQGFGGET